jgi:hypothetical protein
MKCVRTKRKCGGYQREAIFVVDQTTGDSAVDVPLKSYSKTYRKPSIVNERSSSDSSSGSRNGKSRSLSLAATTHTFAPDIEISSPTAFRQQFFVQFLATFVPDIDQAAVRLKIKTEESTWLVLVPGLPEVTRALDTSILALSTARLGRNNNDDRLVVESRRLYGEGLKDLQRALYDPKLMYRDESVLSGSLT